MHLEDGLLRGSRSVSNVTGWFLRAVFQALLLEVFSSIVKLSWSGSELAALNELFKALSGPLWEDGATFATTLIDSHVAVVLNANSMPGPSAACRENDQPVPQQYHWQWLL